MKRFVMCLFVLVGMVSFADAAQLELQDWKFARNKGGRYLIAEGAVKNVSSQSLKNVQAVIVYSDKDGKFITSDNALIEYNPILSGQTSPFKVITKYNPAIKKGAIDFKFLGKGTIEWNKKK